MIAMKKLNQGTTDVTKTDSTVTKLYQPTEEERAARERVRSRPKQTSRVKVSVSSEGERLMADWTLESPAGHYLLMEALGTSDPDFYKPIMSHLLRASTHGPQIDEAEVNFLISVIKGVQPQDQLEAMLASQMGAVHMLTMEFARRLSNADTIAQQDAAERTLNKLCRTFATQVEALKRHRSNGVQKVIVGHLNVNQGGQAVVGNVSHGGGPGASEKRETTP
jgi:hypothetical protein